MKIPHKKGASAPDAPCRKNFTLRYSMIQAFFWINFAALLGFTSPYLLDIGFSNTQIGVIIAASGTISAILQPIIASYADKPSSPSLKRLILSLVLFLLAVSLLLLLSHRRIMLLTGLLYGCGITVLQILTPLINSLGMETLNQGNYINFGVSRGIGSVSYAIGAYVLGIIVSGFGSVSIPVSMLFTFGALLVFILVFPFAKTRKETQKTQAESTGGIFYFFKRYRRFCIVLVGCILVYTSHVLINTFSYQIVQTKGGGSSEMGVAMALAAFAELPTMFLFVHIQKKVRCDILFRITGIFFLLKTLCTLFAPNIPVYYGIQILQMLGFALITVSSVYYVNSIMEEQDAIKGQAFMTMSYTLGTVLGAITGGALIDFAGVQAMLIFATVSAGAGMLIMLFATEKCGESPEKG